MLARRSTLSHTLGTAPIDLPLLVPSFTSKGFHFFEEVDVNRRRGIVQKGKSKKKRRSAGPSKRVHERRKYSQTTRALEWTAPHLQEAFLISSYDIFFEHFNQPEQYFASGAFIFVDSGGYELASDFDSSEPRVFPHAPKPFTAEDYRSVLTDLKKIKSRIPFVVTSFDWDTKQTPIENQIQTAQGLFRQFPDWLHNILLKPHDPTGEVLNVDEVIRHVEKLRAFDIVGVTEKELGKNLIGRLKGIAKLRKAMNEAGVDAPIHVWGGLDPVMTPLYFFAGAEVFDGVSWLRYAYNDGVAVNRECYGVLSQHGLETPIDQAVLLCMNSNITALQRLATNLREFVDLDGQSFKMFGQNEEVFERAYRTMLTKIPQMKGGA